MGDDCSIALDPDAIQWTEGADTPPGEEGDESEGESPPSEPKPTASAAPTTSAPKPKPLAKKPDAGAPKKPLAKKPDAGAPKKPLTNAPDAGAAPEVKEPEEPAGQPVAELTSTAKGSLTALARTVGLEFSPIVLANDKAHLRRRFNDSDRTLLVSNRFSSHASVSTLSRNSSRLAVVLFGTGSFEKAAGQNDKVDFTVRSVSGTFADANKNYREDPDEKPSTFNLVAAVTRPRTGPPLRRAKQDDKGDKKDDKKDDKKTSAKKEENSDEMRAFVLGDADALTNVVMANVPGNQLLFADAIRWLGGEESFAGEVNTEEDVRIEHTKQKDLDLVLRHDLRCSGADTGSRSHLQPASGSTQQREAQVISWRGLSAHLVALAVAAMLALFVWTRKDPAATREKGNVEVWGGNADRVSAISFEAENRSVKLESHKDSAGVWYVGTVEKTIETRPPPSRGPDGGLSSAPPPAPEKKHETTRFISVEQGKKLAESLAPLMAIRGLGKIDEGRAEEFGFDKPAGTLKVTVDGREHSLIIGGTTPGGSDRYVKDDGGQVFAVTGSVAQSMLFAESRLIERTLHNWEEDEVKAAKVEKGGAARDLARVEDKKEGWADGATPTVLDETAGNWMSKLDKLRVMSFEENPAPAPTPESLVVRVDYFGKGKKNVGFVELYKVAGDKGKPKYLAKTEYTRWYAEVLSSTADQNRRGRRLRREVSRA